MALAEPTTREQAVTRQKWLTAATIGWNGAEGVIAIAAGLAAGSVSLIGFGLDSGIEVSAALILAWRLAQERRTGCKQEADRLAQRLIAVSFAALAVYVGVESVRDLVLADRPGQSLVGIVMAALSLATMPLLARAKRRLAPLMGSRAVEAEANQTILCSLMSGALLVGLGANTALGWWWADPLAGLCIAAAAAYAAVATWRADSLADTCCS
ncbi:cation transporter [Candidatus Poriferisodalis sp.]|uniref:cation transporter n=1 Tax=Candidatus Poriferisodalis sp. TaxID=3101277 RepID=UPI003B02114F